MAYSRSNKKRIRQNEKRRLINKTHRTLFRNTVKKMDKMIEGKETEAVATNLPRTLKLIDQSAAMGIIRKGQAARRKSRLMKKAFGLSKNPTAAPTSAT